MVARSVARLTFTCETPSTLRTNRSMRFTHEAQVMPSTSSWMISSGCVGVVGARVSVAVVMSGPDEPLDGGGCLGDLGAVAVGGRLHHAMVHVLVEQADGDALERLGDR